MSLTSKAAARLAASPKPNKPQTYNLKDVPTDSVTLYPTKAHITRHIPDVQLSPNSTHEIVILGLSPTVDENSIRCEGQTAAGNGQIVTVMDMSVQLVPNRELFEGGGGGGGSADELGGSSDSDSGGDEEEEDQDAWKNDAVRALEEQLDELAWQLTEANEVVQAAEERLATWDRFSQSVSAQHWDASQIADNDVRYGEHRAKIFEGQLAGTKRIAELEKAVEKKEREIEKAGREARRQLARIQKQKERERARRRWRKWDKMKEAEYVRNERLRYWPKKVFKVTVLLEVAGLDSAGSSRRNSAGSVTLASSPQQQQQQVATKADFATSNSGVEKTITASLVLSYVTLEAGWNPRYDLNISSVSKTATITYRTEYLNRTSETWKDAKLSFSTSQTSYQGLDDVVPFLNSWRIRLSRYDSGDNGLLSMDERTRIDRPKAVTFNRADAFGRVDDVTSPPEAKHTMIETRPTTTNGPSSSQPQVSMYQQAPKKKEIIYLNGPKAGHRGPVPRQGRAPKLGRGPGSLLGRSMSKFKRDQRSGASAKQGEEDLIDYSDEEVQPNSTVKEEVPQELTDELPPFEIPAWEDNGLTATYDVPGTRTLEPSSQTRRHKIASLHARNIHLSHICVPKLRSATFLRAKIRNPSSTVTLLRGSAGVTLDGSFLGNMNLPRVSPGEVFDVSLGVDPAIHVNYPKPTVRRSTQGIALINKESAQLFERSVWLDNTGSEAVEILVLDQVPVSEDERLRVNIVTPSGLVNEGDSAGTGEAARPSGSKAVPGSGDKKEGWGSAVAKLQKMGEIAWMVKLEGGKGVLLKLVYEAKLPPSERIVSA